MPFSWGAAARGGSDALEQLLAERYAKTQEAERVAREIAREQRAAEQWQQTMAFNQAEATRAGERFTAEQADRTRRIGREDTALARAESTLKNQQGMRQMIGEFVTRIPETGVSPQQRRSLEAMAITEDLELPKSLTAEEEMVTITVPGPGGRPYTRRVPASSLEGQGQEQYRAPVAGPQANMVTLYKVKPDGTYENRDVTEGRAANELYAQGWTKTAPSVSERAKVKTPEAVQEAQTQAATAQGLAQRVLGNKNFRAVWGPLESRLPTFSKDTGDAEADVESLVASLTLENLDKIKGVASDLDSRTVAAAATVLKNGGISEQRAAEELNRIGRELSRASGQPWTDVYPRGTRLPQGQGAPADSTNLDPLLKKYLGQ